MRKKESEGEEEEQEEKKEKKGDGRERRKEKQGGILYPEPFHCLCLSTFLLGLFFYHINFAPSKFIKRKREHLLFITQIALLN